MSSARIAVIVAGAFFITSTIALTAQQNAGIGLPTEVIEAKSKASKVTITVLDATEARIPGALVEIDPSTPDFQAIKTDNAGQVAIRLPAGTHSLTVSARGFSRWKGSAEVQCTQEMVTAKLTVAVSDYPWSVVVRSVDVSHDVQAELIALQPLETLPLPEVPVRKHNRRH